ncbi:hypothetical protein AB0M44_12650 [Streptosporangium subroseum]|uniref:hypothetical protein n=1 Tax=Streptosporangium subroseum TaxID=106412 RepID=UPI003422EC44
MTTGQTVTEPRTGGHRDDEITDATAEKYGRVLAKVQRLLKVRGVRSFIVHTHSLKLFGDGRPLPQGSLGRHAPELVVRSRAGWVVATVTVGSRSGCYLVSMRDSKDTETVPSESPEKVAGLFLPAQFGGGRV